MRKDPLDGAIAYTPVPSQEMLGLTLGSYMEVRAGASLPGSVDADTGIALVRGSAQFAQLSVVSS